MKEFEEYPICKTAVLKIRTDLPVKKSPVQFMDYIKLNFPEKEILKYFNNPEQNHTSYPLVQIKILQGVPVILGINEGIEPVLELKDSFSTMDFGNITFRVLDVDVEEVEYSLRTTERSLIYQFITPWVALDDEDSIRFKYYYENERSAFLNRVLNKNLILIARQFQIPLDKSVLTRLKVKSLNPMPVNGSPHGGFWGGFSCNMILPNFIGIGNGIEKGYGTIYSRDIAEMIIAEKNEENEPEE